MTARSRARGLRAAGALLSVAGAVLLMGIVTAEALYPGRYSTAANTISDLGGTRPGGATAQPSAAIFDGTMVVAGLLVLVAAALVWRAARLRPLALAMACLGIAAACVGVFPETVGTAHTVAALATFFSGGIAAVLSVRATAGPFRYVAGLLGVVALATLVAALLLGDAVPLAALGVGGVERWIAYPILLWVVGFGGYLAGQGAELGRRAAAH